VKGILKTVMTDIKTSINGLTIRYATKDDVKDILYFIKKLAEFENELEYVTATEEDITDSLFNKEAANVIFPIYENSKVGFAVFHRTFSTFLCKPGINLVDLFIKQEMRNRGFGEEILKYLASIVDRENMGRLEWWVHDWNHKAKEFYKRIGSKEIDNIRVYRLDGNNLKNISEK
jgi:GNAT superfamily N-acetyltransferase